MFIPPRLNQRVGIITKSRFIGIKPVRIMIQIPNTQKASQKNNQNQEKPAYFGMIFQFLDFQIFIFEFKLRHNFNKNKVLPQVGPYKISTIRKAIFPFKNFISSKIFCLL